MVNIFRIIGNDGVFCNYKDPAYAGVTNTLINTTMSKFANQTYYLYSDRAIETSDPRISLSTTQLAKFSDPNSPLRKAYENFASQNPDFPGIQSIEVVGPIFSNPPRIAGTIEVGTGSSWIGVVGISVDETGYVVAAIARGRVPTFFEAFHGVANSDVNGSNHFVSKVQAKNYISFNFTGLQPDTNYVVALYTKNLDDTFLTPIPEPVTLYIRTEEEQIITVLKGSRISLSLICIILVYFLTIIT